MKIPDTQQKFLGHLPVDDTQRKQRIQELLKLRKDEEWTGEIKGYRKNFEKNLKAVINEKFKSVLG